LEVTLERAIKQRLRYWVDDYDNVPVPGMPAGGMDVSRNDANDQWCRPPLSAGGYKVRVHTDRRLTRRVDLDGGDLLLLGLSAVPPPPGQSRRGRGERWGEGDLRLSRLLWSETDFPDRPGKSGGGWRLAVLQNQQNLRLGERALQMMTTLEKIPEAREA